jgi:hypothetical protein
VRGVVEAVQKEEFGVNIIWHEIRKIWNLKMLLVLAVFCGLFYFMNMHWHIERFTNPRPETERTNFAKQLRDRYGYALTDEQMEEFIADTLPPLIAEADEFIRTTPIFAEQGATSLFEFRRIQREIWADFDWGSDEYGEPQEWERETSLLLDLGYESRFIGGVIASLEQVWLDWDRIPNELERTISSELRAWSDEFFSDAIAAVENGTLSDFVAGHKAVLTAEADELIANSSQFAAAGLRNYAEWLEYWTTRDAVYDLREERVMWQLFFALFSAEYNHNSEKLYNRVGMIEIFVLPHPHYSQVAAIHEVMEIFTRPTEFEYNRFREIISTNEHQNIMSAAYNAVENYFTQLAMMITFAVLILTVPLIVTDRSRNIHSVQFAAKVGRRLMYHQLTAVTISAFMLSVILTAIFSSLFAVTGQYIWWGHSVVSFMQWAISLFPLTLGQFITVVMLMGLMLGLSMSGIAFIISRFSRNVMLALFAVVPVSIVRGYLTNLIFGTMDTERPLMLGNPLYQMTRIVGIEIIACAVMVVIALAVAWWVSNREKRVDVS